MMIFFFLFCRTPPFRANNSKSKVMAPAADSYQCDKTSEFCTLCDKCSRAMFSIENAARGPKKVGDPCLRG